MKELTSYPQKTSNRIIANIIKSVCVGGRLIDNYSPNDYTEVRATIDSWIALGKDKEILRMRGKHTIENWQWIYWN